MGLAARASTAALASFPDAPIRASSKESIGTVCLIRQRFIFHLHLEIHQIYCRNLSLIMDPEVVQNFLSEQREATPEELQQSFLNIEDFWERKLWHQLTELLTEYFNTSASATQRIPLFKRFILSFAEKINQLQLVTLGLLAATQYAGLSFHRRQVP